MNQKDEFGQEKEAMKQRVFVTAHLGLAAYM